MKNKKDFCLLNSVFPLFYTSGSGSAFWIRIHVTDTLTDLILDVVNWFDMEVVEVLRTDWSHGLYLVQ